MIDSGLSGHITRLREHLDTMIEETDDVQLTIGDDFAHPVKGVGTFTINRNSSISLQLTRVLFVLGIKSKLISISALEDNGHRVTFMDGKVLAWPKKSTIKKAQTIGMRQGYLCKFCTETIQAFILETSDSNKI